MEKSCKSQRTTQPIRNADFSAKIERFGYFYCVAKSYGFSF